MAETSRIHQELKRCLREAGRTYADVARHLSLSEASVKRLFAQESLSVRRLEQVCELAGTSFSELVARMESRREYLTTLTLEQEKALASNPKLLLQTYMLLSGAGPFGLCESFRVSRSEAQRLLVRLDRLKIIELRPLNRIKLLTARNFRWRPDGPVQRLFRNHVQGEFLDADFTGGDEALRFVSGLVSRATLERLRQGIDDLAREFEEGVRHDASLPRDDRIACSSVLAARPWEPSVFAELRR